MADRINMIKTQLNITDNSQDVILTELFERYLRMAKSICIREDEPPVMLDIVQDIVAGAYQQRGGEAFSSSNVGNQQYTHIDLFDTMRKRLIEARLKLARVKFI